MRLLWHRLTESPDARRNRIRQFGFMRYCAAYALIFPLCHALAAGLRAALTGNLGGLKSLPVELLPWSLAGGGVATVFWLAVALPRRPRPAKAESRPA